LRQTVPSYIQEGVSKLILVDDCSSDSTRQVAEELTSKYPYIIQYVYNSVNKKQAFSKNVGKNLANTEFVYFGDDDSILVDGSLKALMETSVKYCADIVGAVALYCKENENPRTAYKDYLLQDFKYDAKDFVDLSRLRFSFACRPKHPIQLPVTQAAMLVKKRWYKNIDFDTQYIGNCYREETDFILQAQLKGARIYLDGRALQINLPRAIASGGARSSGRILYEFLSILNTWKFLRKHRNYYRNALNTHYFVSFCWYVSDRCKAAIRKVMI